MESLRSVRVRQQGARARREPCPSRGSGQARAVEPGGVQQYMAHHGRAVTRVPALQAAVINVYLEVDIALWPASCRWTGSGPHGCCARPAVDPGVVEDHAWAGTVRSARNPARSSPVGSDGVFSRSRKNLGRIGGSPGGRNPFDSC